MLDTNCRKAARLILTGAAVFAVLVFLLPPSRGRTLSALVEPSATLVVVSIWWLGNGSLAARTRAVGVGLAAAALLLLAFTTSYPATIISILWGFPACMCLTAAVFCLWSGRAWSRPRLAVGAVFLAALAPWPLLRADGASGQMMPNLVWAWQAANDPVEFDRAPSQPTDVSVVETVRDWPGYRGPRRNGIVPAAAAAELNLLDWRQRPPPESWRRAIGPGWSSFAVVGNLACTQDQAGEMERVICLDARTGRTVWAHSEQARFDELAGGAGPRATPLIHDGRLYSLGATGALNSFVAATGELIWSVGISDGSGEVPQWGFASSPLIEGELLYVSPAGIGGVRLLALDRRTGDRVWEASGVFPGYSSPQVATLAGKRQVLLLDGGGLASYQPQTGEPLWEYAWQSEVPKVAQPHVLGGNTVVIGMGYGRGTKRIRITRTENGWVANEVWSTGRLKPKFNDFVVHDEHIFGLDEGILACIDASTGRRVWKGGRYGYGQLVLAGQTLLVVSEAGDLVLVEATATGHNELARIGALRGKTWSHPSVARGRLLIRNGSEAACYDLSVPVK